jgi:hypothetical protein
MSLYRIPLPTILLLAACSATSNSDPDGAPGFADATPILADAAPALDAAPAPVAFRINEVLKNSPGSADDHEFVEIVGAANTDLSGYAVLVLESDEDAADTAGILDLRISLGTTDSAGFYVTDFFGDVIENGSISLLLVRGADASLIEGVDLDSDDDGHLDLQPWAELVDAVALIDDAGDLGYADVLLTNDVGGLGEEFVGASRFPDGQDSGAVSDWVRSNESGAGLEGLAGASGALCESCGSTPAVPGSALLTPGAANAIASDS